MIKLMVKGVAVDKADNHVMVLETSDGRSLLVEISKYDAHLVSLTQEGIKLSTPLFSDLIRDMCNLTGCKLLAVYITGLNVDIFESKLEVEYDGKQVMLDARLVDAVVLALDNDLPIYMSPSLERYLKETPEIVDKESENFYLN